MTAPEIEARALVRALNDCLYGPLRASVSPVAESSSLGGHYAALRLDSGRLSGWDYAGMLCVSAPARSAGAAWDDLLSRCGRGEWLAQPAGLPLPPPAGSAEELRFRLAAAGQGRAEP